MPADAVIAADRTICSLSSASTARRRWRVGARTARRAHHARPMAGWTEVPGTRHLRLYTRCPRGHVL